MPDQSPCPSCGQLNRKSASFCRECGAPLGVAAEQETSEPSPEPAGPRSPGTPTGERPTAPPPGEPGPKVDAAEQKHRSRWHYLAVPLAVILALAILTLAGWQARWPTFIFGAAKPRAAGRPSVPPAATRPPSPAQPTSPAVPTRSPAASTSSPAPSASSPGPSRPVTSGRSSGPAGTLTAYVAAINGHDYASAWRIIGKATGESYPSFVNGFNGTVADTLTIISIDGNVVTAQLAARQTDGTVRIYQGTYTIQNGAIVQYHVQRIS